MNQEKANTFPELNAVWREAWAEYLAADTLLTTPPESEALCAMHLWRAWTLLGRLWDLEAGRAVSGAVPPDGADLKFAGEREREQWLERQARLSAYGRAAPGELPAGRPFRRAELLRELRRLRRTLNRCNARLRRNFGLERWYEKKRVWQIAGGIALAAAVAWLLKPGPDFKVELISQEWGALQHDRSVDRHLPLTIAGRVYPQGLGTHSVSRIRLTLRRPCRQVTGACGVDDETDGAGTIDCRVLKGGKVVFASGLMRGKQPAREFRVETGGVKELILEMGNADGNNYSDHADWVALECVR